MRRNGAGRAREPSPPQGSPAPAWLDLRYVGQEFTLSVPVSAEQLEAADRSAVRRAFDALYQHRYAHHSPKEPVEIVNLRLTVIGKRPRMSFPRLPGTRGAEPARRHEAYFGGAERPLSCPVYRRDRLGGGARFAGPALVREHGTTTVLPEGAECKVAETGELIIAVGAA